MNCIRPVLLFCGCVQLGVFIGTSHSQPSYGQITSPCPTQTLSVYSGITPSRSNDLVCVLPQVFGPGGLVGTDNGGPMNPTTGHEAHFQASSVRSFAPLNEEIGIMLNNMALAAPVAQFVFENGTVVLTTQDLGPILSDSADTLGKGRFYFGAAFQYFEFDRVDGMKFNAIDAVFRHEYEQCIPGTDTGSASDCLPSGVYRFTKDVIATSNRLTLSMNQFSITGAYGVTGNLDLAFTVPVVHVHMGVSSDASIWNVPTTDPPCSQEHTFVGTDCLNMSFSNLSSATGIGDMLVRAKYRAIKREKSSIAVGMEFRIPTGDAYNYLGAGTWGIRPFGIITGHLGRISPHASLSFQGNGQSILAGDVTGPTVVKAHLPDMIAYTGGVDAMVTHRFGAVVDFLGQTLLNGTRVAPATYPGYSDPDFSGAGYTIPSQPDLKTFSSTFTIASVAPGVKVIPISNLTITLSGLFRLNDSGLHAQPAPMAGVSYSF